MTCTHHWILDTPEGTGVSTGKCRKCGATKTFDGGNFYTTQTEHRTKGSKLGWSSFTINVWKPNPQLMSDEVERPEEAS